MSDVSNPKNIPLRPLDKGMMRDISSHVLPKGALFTAKNFIVKRGGPYRRPGFLYYANSTAVNANDQPCIGIAPLWKTTGSQIAILLTSRYLYTITAYTSPTAYYWSYTTGTVTVSGSTVEGAGGMLWNTAASKIRPNDVMVLDADASGDGPESVEISSITDDDTLVLKSTPVGTYGAGTDYAIYRRFNVQSKKLLDWTVVDNKLVVTDYDRYGLYSFDGTTFTEFDTYANCSYKSACVTYFADRIWLGNIIDSAGDYYRQRIRWSSPTAHTGTSAWTAADYLDLPYSSGAVKRLVGLGNFIVAYFDDAVYIGRPSNLVDLPYVFDNIESGGIGLVGPRAITPFLNGHVFVGQDDIYFLSNQGIQSIGSPVVSETIDKCSNVHNIYAATDPNNERICIGFPEDGSYIEKIWTLNSKTKAWSYDEVSCTSLSNPQLDLQLTWGDLPGVLSTDSWTGLGTDFATWDDIEGQASLKDLFITEDGYTYKLTTTNSTDEAGSIEAIIETGDLDLDMPDMDKTVHRVTMKLSERPSADLTFVVQGSWDDGNSWKSLTNLTISSTSIEGQSSFKLTGSALRFRFTTTSAVEPFTIAEICFRISLRGREFNFD